MKDIIERFQYTIEKKRLSHLYLLSGGSLYAQKAIVRELAYLIFKSFVDDPHLKKKLESENHPNFMYISKEGQSIKKEQVLSLQQEFSKTSLVSGPRIYVIEATETMSQAAANSLLKFLEEPKDNETIGFLLTTDQNLVLSTIKSRSQVILIEEESESSFTEYLIKNQVKEKDAYFIPLLTKEFEEAILLIGEPNYQLSVQLFERIMTAILQGESSLSLIFFELEKHFYHEKRWLTFIFELISRMMLDALHVHMHQKIVFESFEESILALVRKLSVKCLESIMRLCHEVIAALRLPVNVSMILQKCAIELEEVILDGAT